MENITGNPVTHKDYLKTRLTHSVVERTHLGQAAAEGILALVEHKVKAIHRTISPVLAQRESSLYKMQGK